MSVADSGNSRLTYISGWRTHATQQTSLKATALLVTAKTETRLTACPGSPPAASTSTAAGAGAGAASAADSAAAATAPCGAPRVGTVIKAASSRAMSQEPSATARKLDFNEDQQQQQPVAAGRAGEGRPPGTQSAPRPGRGGAR
jgi:hypothetical protein